jgi:carbonic anhydrase
VIELDLGDLGRGHATGRAPTQAPFAAVLGCSDARVPVEMVLQQGSNDLFVVRVAGGVLGAECLGSLHYAAQHFGDTIRVVAVLAHAHCGAVSAAVDTFLVPPRYLRLAGNTALRSIVDQLMSSVRGSAMALERAHGPRVTARPGYRAALVETSVTVNAAWTAFSVREELRARGLTAVFGVYDLVSRRVRLPLSPVSALTRAEGGFFPPPRDAVGFRALGLRLAESPFVRSLLGG